MMSLSRLPDNSVFDLPKDNQVKHMSTTPEIIPQIIEYDFFHSRFGECLIARSNDGICRLEFVGRSREHVLRRLAKVHRNARLRKRTGELVVLAEAAFEPMTADRPRVHLQGTDFQIAVWNMLLEIPPGTTVSYRIVAERVSGVALFALGSTVGSNMR